MYFVRFSEEEPNAATVKTNTAMLKLWSASWLGVLFATEPRSS